MNSARVDVVVIGAGQAGLSAAYHLQRRGLDHVVLDAEEGPGGAWRHRWRSLRMATVNGISDLPGIAKPAVDPDEASSEFLTRYFREYEEELGLAVRRPVKVRSVSRVDNDLRAGWPFPPPAAIGQQQRSSTPRAPGPGRSGPSIQGSPPSAAGSST